jgi:hypothetical protein
MPMEELPRRVVEAARAVLVVEPNKATHPSAEISARRFIGLPVLGIETEASRLDVTPEVGVGP